MGVSGGLYRLVLLLHILTVVVGFGGIIVNAGMARAARQRGGAEGVAIGEASAAVTKQVSQNAFYAVPVFGILLVVLSDGTFGFEEPWVGAAIVLYLAAAAILVAVVGPSQRRANELAAGLVANRSAGSAGAEMKQLDKKLAAFTGVFNLLFLAVLALMIFKPGI
jgi:uncharacterized membrane protein